MALSHRLSVLRSFYEDAPSIWDIGCDHGLLGLSFLGHPEVSCINLVDPSALVIEALHKKIAGAYIANEEFLKIHHKKGQEVILDPVKKTIFVAGMGGKEIMEITEAFLPQMGHEDRMVVSPHRKVLELRAWLHEIGVHSVQETVVFEDGQFYPVFCFEKGLPNFHLYGREIFDGPTGEAYRLHQLRTFERHQDEASKKYVSFLRKPGA